MLREGFPSPVTGSAAKAMQDGIAGSLDGALSQAGLSRGTGLGLSLPSVGISASLDSVARS